MHRNAEAVHLPEGQPSSSFQLGNSKKRAAILSSATPETSRMMKRATAAATKQYFSLWSLSRCQPIVSVIRCERRNRIRFAADRMPNDDLPLSSAMIAAILLSFGHAFVSPFTRRRTMTSDSLSAAKVISVFVLKRISSSSGGYRSYPHGARSSCDAQRCSVTLRSTRRGHLHPQSDLLC